MTVKWMSHARLFCAAAMLAIGCGHLLAQSDVETVLYSFEVNGTRAGVIRDTAGNLYGTTEFGGTYGGGTVFQLSPGGVETALYSFRGGTDGTEPEAGVILDAAGNLYGTTLEGGAYGYGTVFQLTPQSVPSPDGAFPRPV